VLVALRLRQKLASHSRDTDPTMVFPSGLLGVVFQLNRKASRVQRGDDIFHARWVMVPTSSVHVAEG
jgi:hypothetical protein